MPLNLERHFCFQATDQARYESVGLRQRGQAGALHEHRRARGVELDQLADRVGQCGRHHQPTQPPAGHQKALGEAVRHDQPVVGVGDVEKTRRRFSVPEEHPFVDLVRNDPGAGAAAVVEDGLLLGARQRPAGRIVRRIDQQHAGLRSHRAQQRVHVERPRASPNLERHALHRGTQDGRLRGQVGPHRDHGHHLVAGAGQRLHRQHQCVHARRGDGDAVGPDGAVQPADVARQRLTQRRQAEVVRIERVAAVDRCHRRIAHERRCGLIAFAEPEGQHVAASEAGVRHFANLRARKVAHHRPQGRTIAQVLVGSVSLGST